MNQDRFHAITRCFSKLQIAVVGDFFLDRYLIIDPSFVETSIETGLPVHNVVSVRSQPGAAGTIVNNLAALGIGTIHAVGFCGDDGEGYELRKGLRDLGVKLDHFLTVANRRTPVYCKPLVVEPPLPPRELSRLDSKNWSETPRDLQDDLATRLVQMAPLVDAMIVMDQVDVPETGVVTRRLLEAASTAQSHREGFVILADSRRGMAGYPPLGFKMNGGELARTMGIREDSELAKIVAAAGDLARQTGRPLFVSLAERGLVGVWPGSPPEQVPAMRLRGPIDVVGAGDSVTASLTATLASGASVREAMEFAMAAASIVIHQLGTTGTASVSEVGHLLKFEDA